MKDFFEMPEKQLYLLNKLNCLKELALMGV